MAMALPASSMIWVIAVHKAMIIYAAKPNTPLHLGFLHDYHDVFVQDKIKIK